MSFIGNKRAKGTEEEALAAEFLERHGYKIIEKNFYTRKSEIDIIARDGEYLVFVEVKYRRDITSGYPEEAVDQRKIRRIIYGAREYLWKHHYPEETPVRFDVAAILGDHIRLIKDAFRTF